MHRGFTESNFSLKVCDCENAAGTELAPPFEINNGCLEIVERKYANLSTRIKECRLDICTLLKLYL